MNLRDVAFSRVGQGLIRLWAVLTILWLAIVIFLVAPGSTMATGKLAGLAIWPPLVLLLGAIGTIWVVQGFTGRRDP